LFYVLKDKFDVYFEVHINHVLTSLNKIIERPPTRIVTTKQRNDGKHTRDLLIAMTPEGI